MFRRLGIQLVETRPAIIIHHCMFYYAWDLSLACERCIINEAFVEGKISHLWPRFQRQCPLYNLLFLEVMLWCMSINTAWFREWRIPLIRRASHHSIIGVSPPWRVLSKSSSSTKPTILLRGHMILRRCYYDLWGTPLQLPIPGMILSIELDLIRIYEEDVSIHTADENIISGMDISNLFTLPAIYCRYQRWVLLLIIFAWKL